jgi:hypothetical protein
LTRFDWADSDEGGGGKGFVEGRVFELLADIAALGPFPEFVFPGFGGLGGQESEAAFFNGDAAGAEVATAESDDIGGDVAEVVEVGFGFVAGGEVVSGGGEVECDPVDEFVSVGGGDAGFGRRGVDEVLGSEADACLVF